MADYWPTADTNPSAPEHVVEFARIWRDMPKIVFSTTLEKVDWNSRLVITPDGILMVPCRATRGQSERIQPFERKRSRCRSRTNLRRSGPTPPEGTGVVPATLPRSEQAARPRRLRHIPFPKRRLKCDLEHDRPRPAAVRSEIKSTRATRPGHPMVRTAVLCAAHARVLREMGPEIVGS